MTTKHNISATDSDTVVLFFFFFYNSGYHRDLHSFPTRRSSDLAFVPSPRESPSNGGSVQSFVCPQTARPTIAANTAIRSEEHTSELQSRPHLVCRLLLEKKK